MKTQRWIGNAKNQWGIKCTTIVSAKTRDEAKAKFIKKIDMIPYRMVVLK